LSPARFLPISMKMDQITRTPKRLGTVLLRYRKAAGLSQKAIAARIHLRQATISALENSANNTRLGTLFDTLAALDLELVVRPRTKGSTKEIEGIF
jgi:HTH-type transcriptional regulator/antitoxin HipB